MTTTPAAEPREDLAVLDAVQRRVLWLATAMVHHANRVRPNPIGLKVGGHQASSASMVSIMTALWFEHLRRPDRVSVKPHASPVLHAINYLLGELDARYLTTLREFGGLQSYPSRTKDPDPVDYSTGSVGSGPPHRSGARSPSATSTPTSGCATGGRQYSLLGDAELDEGAVWEAVADPMVAALGEVLWVVDLNRQSLDRVVPDIATGRLAGMFAAAGWQVVTVKYGPALGALSAPGRRCTARRIDADGQRGVPAPAARRRGRGTGAAAGGRRRPRRASRPRDAELLAALRDLGGHDLGALLEAYRGPTRSPTARRSSSPTRSRAGGCPPRATPSNHSALLHRAEELAVEARADPEDPWRAFAEGSAGGRAVRGRGGAAGPAAGPAARAAVPSPRRPARPAHAGRARPSRRSAACSLDLVARRARGRGARRDGVARRRRRRRTWAAGSTGRGSGRWATASTGSPTTRETLVRWREDEHGQHIELGIAEVNLVGLLGELGATWSRAGEPLLPIGTIYDPFVGRALEPWSFGIYAGGQSILVGTPRGVTLAPGGRRPPVDRHPGIGIEQPGCVAWEPAFGQDFEWAFLAALGAARPPRRHLGVLPADLAAARPGAGGRPRTGRPGGGPDMLAGGYVLRPARPGAVGVGIVCVGAVVPEALAAADEARRGAEVVLL